MVYNRKKNKQGYHLPQDKLIVSSPKTAGTKPVTGIHYSKPELHNLNTINTGIKI